MEFYQAAGRMELGDKARATFARLSQQSSKNRAMLERTRRENVAEMILEPITGLQREDYLADLALRADMHFAEVLARALDLEEKGRVFYTAAAEKVSLPEVSRVFKRLASGRADNLSALASLSQSS